MIHIENLLINLQTGVITANINNGIDDNMRSHLHPKLGITISAIATSKQAPRAQKH